MGLEQEQGYLKTDRWYYDYTKEKFIDVAKKYPYMPFCVDNGISVSYYRWNEKKRILECADPGQILIGYWQIGILNVKEIIPGKPYLSFIVFTQVLTKPFYEKQEGIEIIINSTKQELVPRTRMKVVGSCISPKCASL